MPGVEPRLTRFIDTVHAYLFAVCRAAAAAATGSNVRQGVHNKGALDWVVVLFFVFAWFVFYYRGLVAGSYFQERRWYFQVALFQEPERERERVCCIVDDVRIVRKENNRHYVMFLLWLRYHDCIFVV